MEISFDHIKEYLISDEIVVVDPSYILDENKWNVIEDLILLNEKMSISGVLHVDDVEFFIFRTYFEDGVFDVKIHNETEGEIDVDSGFIAIFKKQEFEKITHDNKLGLEVHIDEKGLVELTSEGVIEGPIQINTHSILEDLHEDEDEGNVW